MLEAQGNSNESSNLHESQDPTSARGTGKGGTDLQEHLVTPGRCVFFRVNADGQVSWDNWHPGMGLNGLVTAEGPTGTGTGDLDTVYVRTAGNGPFLECIAGPTVLVPKRHLTCKLEGWGPAGRGPQIAKPVKRNKLEDLLPPLATTVQSLWLSPDQGYRQRSSDIQLPRDIFSDTPTE